MQSLKFALQMATERRVLLAGREAVGREPVVLARQRQAQGVDAVGAEHRVDVDRPGVVAIPFLLRGGQRDGGVVGLVLLRRPFGDPARAPAGVGADLVIDAVDRVPDARFGDGGVVQVRPRRNLNRAPLVQPHPLDVDEEVDLVLLDRTANRPAELVLLGVGLVEVVLLLEEVLRPQVPVVEELEGAAVELVRAGLDHGVDDRAGGAAELGVELSGEDLELLRRVERHARLGAVVLPQVVVVVPAAVHQVAVVARVDAVGRQRVRSPRRQVRRRHDAGQQAGEVGEVARDARDLGELLGGDVAANLLRRHVDERRLRGDGDGLLDAAELELNVDVHLVADRDRDVAPQEFLEALDLRRDLIAAGRQRGDEPHAVGAAQRLAKRSRVLIGDGDRDPGQGAGLLVGHPPSHLRRAFLCDGRRCGQTPPDDNHRDANANPGHVALLED